MYIFYMHVFIDCKNARTTNLAEIKQNVIKYLEKLEKSHEKYKFRFLNHFTKYAPKTMALIMSEKKESLLIFR